MLKVGIVGLPNVGKSTLFNAVLKRQQALSANYPFATIEPNIGVVDVIDKRLQKVREILFETEIASKGTKKLEDIPLVYANIEFVDIAGLVEGASKGEGLGNQFLANIREVDMVLQVVRDFSDPNIIREHSKNPEQDTDVINSELLLKDIESIEKRIKGIGRDPKAGEELAILNKYLQHLNEGNLAYDLNPFAKAFTGFNPDQGSTLNKVSEKVYLKYIRPLFLLTDKELVYIFNVDEDDERLQSPTQNETYKDREVVFISAKLEAELSSLDNEDQKQYLKDLGIAEPGLDKITRLCFERLGLISFFTAGEMEVRAWEIKKSSNAVEASGAIHTDFMKSFIKAEVVGYQDYVEFGGIVKAREKGKLRLEGKEYIVKDGDIIEFKIGA